MKAYTDYPIIRLGDEEGKAAPLREITVLSYDGDKYCKIKVGRLRETIKACYIYQRPGCCECAPKLTKNQLRSLEKQ